MKNRAASGTVSVCGKAVLHPARGGVYYLHIAFIRTPTAVGVQYSAGR